MDVFSAQKCADHALISAHGRDYAQLDLRIVGAEQHPVLAARHKKVANPLAALGANRNILQVRIRRRQPPCGRHRLVKRGVDASGARIHQLRKRVHVRALKLAHLPPFQELVDNRVLLAKILEHLFARGVLARLGLFGLRVKLQAVKQHLAELLGRTEVKIHSGEFAHFGFESGGIFAQLHRIAGQALEVHGHSGAFHVGQHGDERSLHAVQHTFKPRLDQLGLKRFMQLPRDVGIFGCVLGHLGSGHVAHAFLVLALRANQGFDRNRSVAQVVLCERIHSVALVGLNEVVRQHRVAQRSGQADPVVRKDLVVVLKVVADPGHGGIFPARAEQLQPSLSLGPIRRKRHVVGRVGLPAQRESDHFSLKGIEPGGFGVKSQLGQPVERTN